ncbi:MAG: endo-1,4-beta-xylanase [Armatimonadetes bacterium]|nr:endo-1,4-beta-xylanase [Armatimonadota bacterium]MCX7968809.1 endo-1,4-beta-xylanase [Armatimonadota bacterium]MDW8144229.1 endo-1,4-beta-xylanase [Armatimonadota bacterium]
MKRRDFVTMVAGIAGATVLSKGVWRSMEEVVAQEEQLLATAKERIEQLRKGDVSFVVKTTDGKPARNAQLALTQTRHAFLFGCNIFRWGRIPDPKREELYREKFAAIFNFATLPFYWSPYEWVRGKPNHEYIDKVLEWCQQQGITCKGHPLVWDSPASSPDHWLPEDHAEIEKLSTGRVREIMQRFAGRIDIWDVVNEPTHLSPRSPNKTKMAAWGMAIGPVKYTALHLKVAREANPKATLLVNDYRTDEAYRKILQQLKDENGRWLFDVVGIQSHMHGGVWTVQRTWEVCERFAQLGLPLHFTETTIVSGSPAGFGKWGQTTPEGEEKQAEATVRFYTVLFSHPAVEAITWWDFSDDGAWMGAPAGWLRRDMSPKPVYERMLELIKGEWWTKAKGATDKEGKWQTKAFYGEHELTIQTQDGRKVSQKVTVRKGAENRFEIRLPR